MVEQFSRIEPGPYRYEISWGTITQCKDEDSTSLYLNVVDWPTDEKFIVFGVDNDVLSASLLATGEAIEFKTKVDGSSGHNVITLEVPKSAPDEYVSVIKLVVAPICAGVLGMLRATLEKPPSV